MISNRIGSFEDFQKLLYGYINSTQLGEERNKYQGKYSEERFKEYLKNYFTYSI